MTLAYVSDIMVILSCTHFELMWLQEIARYIKTFSFAAMNRQLNLHEGKDVNKPWNLDLDIMSFYWEIFPLMKRSHYGC